jgi:hypothetical protein
VTEDELANLLALSASLYYRSNALGAVPELQAEAMKELHSYGVLSVAAIAAIVGATQAHGIKVLGRDSSWPRGKLNPEHIAWLGYAVSQRKIKPDTLRKMLKGGTSISTIEDLTGISRSNLNRWRKQ